MHVKFDMYYFFDCEVELNRYALGKGGRGWICNSILNGYDSPAIFTPSILHSIIQPYTALKYGTGIWWNDMQET